MVSQSTFRLVKARAPLSSSVSEQLDALRGLTAILVVLTHVNQIIVVPTNHMFAASAGLLGQAAVMMFFALSGFLIASSIRNNRAKHGCFNVRIYAADRFNRIVPPLLLSMLIALALWLAAPFTFDSGSTKFSTLHVFSTRSGFEVSVRDLLGAALFLNGFLTDTPRVNGPLWSLSYEIWYYVAAGLAAAIPGKKGAVGALVLLCLLAALNRTFLLLAAVWFAGATIAFADNRQPRVLVGFRAVGGTGLVVAVVLGAMYARSGWGASSPDQLAHGLIRYFNLSIGLFFAAVLNEIVNRHFSLPRVATSSARYSYTLYVTHFPILLFIYGAFQSSIEARPSSTWVAAGLALLTCWAAARFAFGWVERLHPLNAGKRFQEAAVIPPIKSSRH